MEYTSLAERVSAFMASPGSDDFESIALAIFDFQRRHNEPYAKWCAHRGVTTPQSWKEIPAVPQSAFKHSALRTFSEAETVKTFRTSGTTGEGYGQHHFREVRLYEESILRGWDFFKLPQLPQIILTPTPVEAPYSSLNHMMGTLAARTTSQRFHADLQIASLLHELKAPVLLLGTALAFLHLFERGKKFTLPVGSFAMETGGYKGTGRTLAKAELYAMFTESLGLPVDSVINEYGMTELSTPSYTHGLDRAHLAPPWLRFLIINPETGAECAEGEIGLLRLYDLANVGSVLALETQDLAVRSGDGFVLLGRDPSALPRGCSRAADEMLSNA
ncbi:MAG: hypothetical protein QM796_08905 [Chthoniobacteraceae bacterium]